MIISQNKDRIVRQKTVPSILNAVKNSLLYFYLYRETIFKLIKKFWHQRLDKVLSKYSLHSKSVREVKYYDQTTKYLK